MEARACLAGGHSVQDEEPKYGLVVYGEVPTKDLWKVTGARAGDVLLLTKPLGTGLLTTAGKAGLASPEHLQGAVETMARLNDAPLFLTPELRSRVHACTDVTGFGLGCHALDLLSEGTLDLQLFAANLPVLPGALEAASMGLIPAGAYSNRDHAGTRVRMGEGVSPPLEDLIFDLVPDDGSSPLRDVVEVKFPTAAYAVLELNIDRWADLADKCAKLVHLTRPRDLDPELGPGSF